MAKKKPKKKTSPPRARKPSPKRAAQHEVFDPSPVDGKQFLRALAYAFKACPKSEELVRLAHIVFIGNRVVGSDGKRWHVGYLPPECAIVEPVVVARQSAGDLLLALDYALRQSNRHSSTFSVKMGSAMVTIDYGMRNPIEHTLALCDVGHVPNEWEEPVDETAPAVTPSAGFSCDEMDKSIVWYRSWETNKGDAHFRSGGEGKPLRIDIRSNSERVASAFLLPSGHPRAYLVPNEPLLDRIPKGRKLGQSILDLQIDPEGNPYEKAAAKDEPEEESEGEEQEAEERDEYPAGDEASAAE